MNEQRLKDILLCALELLRAELQDNFYDQKDCDDFIFSELDMEVSEILEIYDGSNLNVYTGSAFMDGTSPKNWADLRRQLGASKDIAWPKEDVCPVCGAVIDDPTGGDEDGYGNLYMHWHCDECNSRGKSIYESGGWHFVEHEVDERGV